MIGIVTKLVPVISGILFSSLAQLNLKKASQVMMSSMEWYGVLLLSIICYAISFLSYYYALKYFPLSRIGPVMTVGVVTLVVLFGMLTGEIINWRQGLGICMSIFAIVLLLW